ncbi:hypothetical protein G6F63_016449 [Rhizopus arrhizus]|nr:hypothetical protein G6F63_016449 [Rhizopus arrhizus]
MTKQRIHVQGARVLVMGLAFKENCPDLRNTRIVDIVHELRDYNVDVDVYDPWVDAEEAVHEYGLTPVATLEEGKPWAPKASASWARSSTCCTT